MFQYVTAFLMIGNLQLLSSLIAFNIISSFVSIIRAETPSIDVADGGSGCGCCLAFTPRMV